MMGRKTNSTPYFIESDGLFITKPFDVANFIDYLICKIRQEMPTMNSEPSYSRTQKEIMKEKHCKLEFCKVSVGVVQKLFLSINF